MQQGADWTSAAVPIKKANTKSINTKKQKHMYFTLTIPTLQGHSAVGRSRDTEGWAIQGYSGVGHFREYSRTYSAWHWGLQGYSGVGSQFRDILRLSILGITPRIFCIVPEDQAETGRGVVAESKIQQPHRRWGNIKKNKRNQYQDNNKQFSWTPGFLVLS